MINIHIIVRFAKNAHILVCFAGHKLFPFICTWKYLWVSLPSLQSRAYSFALKRGEIFFFERMRNTGTHYANKGTLHFTLFLSMCIYKINPLLSLICRGCVVDPTRHV